MFCTVTIWLKNIIVYEELGCKSIVTFICKGWKIRELNSQYGHILCKLYKMNYADI